MPNPLFRPPEKLIQEWPEVFEDMYMNTMPVAYLKSVRLEFDNGRIWEIDIQSNPDYYKLSLEDREKLHKKMLHGMDVALRYHRV